MNEPLRIAADTRVTLHFTLRLASGEIVDSTRGADPENPRPPATFVVGDESFLPGFEQALLGLKAGDRRSVLIEPKGGFGERNPENIQVMDRVLFAPGVQLARGLMISFADKKGELPGVVLAVDGDKVTVDFNHPLAGRELGFDVEIIAVERVAADVPVTLRNATPREVPPQP